MVMKIVSADFILAAENRRHYPAGGLPEVAFAGRSNVGKSSMINALLARRNLVRTSRTPGLTRKLNFYLINGSFFFVDLPGYGYAAVPLPVRKQWGPMVETYLKSRQELAGVVVIVDARRMAGESDIELMRYLESYRIPTILAVTKADKLSKSELSAQERRIRETIADTIPVVIFSSHSGMGKKELWKEIKSLIEWTRSRG